MESSRTFLASRTHFEVLGLEGQVLGLGLEASRPRKLACPRLEDSIIFWIVKILWSAWKIFWKRFFCGDRLKNFWEDLFFFYFGDRLKNFCEDFFFFLESTCACVLGPWPRAFLSLASRVSVLGKAVLGLGLGSFLCPWPWALCPRLHLCFQGCKNKQNMTQISVNIAIFPKKSEKLDVFDALESYYSLFSTLSYWSIFRMKKSYGSIPSQQNSGYAPASTV